MNLDPISVLLGISGKENTALNIIILLVKHYVYHSIEIVNPWYLMKLKI